MLSDTVRRFQAMAGVRGGSRFPLFLAPGVLELHEAPVRGTC